MSASRDGEHGGEGTLAVSSGPGTWAAAAAGNSPARSWCGNVLAVGPGGAGVVDEVAEKTLDAITRGDPEVLVDEAARRVRSLLSGPLDLLYPT